jgi:hypothetical protein
MRVLSDGRIRRTSAEWNEIISRHRESGLPIATFCEQEEISRSAFASWRRKLSGSREKPATFVELRHPRTKSAVKSALTSTSLEGTSFELALPGGVMLRWRG